MGRGDLKIQTYSTSFKGEKESSPPSLPVGNIMIAEKAEADVPSSIAEDTGDPDTAELARFKPPA